MNLQEETNKLLTGLIVAVHDLKDFRQAVNAKDIALARAHFRCVRQSVYRLLPALEEIADRLFYDERPQ